MTILLKLWTRQRCPLSMTSQSTGTIRGPAMNFEHPIGACLEFKYLIGSEEDASRQLIKNSALDNLISLEKNKIKRYSNFILLILSLLGIASRQSTNFNTLKDRWRTQIGILYSVNAAWDSFTETQWTFRSLYATNYLKVKVLLQHLFLLAHGLINYSLWKIISQVRMDRHWSTFLLFYAWNYVACASIDESKRQTCFIWSSPFPIKPDTD